MSYTLHIPPPWQALPQRRGDPLGFRDIARAIADAWAPGISGRQRDARWLTLLCKALAAMKCDDKSEPECYALMSKFESGILVAATQDGNTGKGRHLPGKRVAAYSWPKRYRYYGPWGTYKPLLITCGLVYKNNPWLLTEQGLKLASVIKEDFFLDGRTADVAGGKNGLKNFEPWFPAESIGQPLDKAEINILCPLLFGNDDGGRARAQTVRNMSQDSFQNFCEQLPLHPDAYSFDEFTRACLGILKQALDTSTLGRPIALPTNTIKNPPTGLEWPAPKDLAEQVHASSNQAKTIIDWHVSHAIKAFFEADASGSYRRVAPSGATMSSGYSYRLWSLWCLARQICPSQFGNVEYPDWLNSSTKSDVEGEDND